MTRVVVAMSGGVDSSVAAALMKQQGHEVIGVTMTLAPNEESSAHKGRGCCSVWDVTDAEKVAWKLDIPHYTFNLRDAFEKHVISDFISEYEKGRTPNPCRRCNQHIKFDHFLERAEALDAEAVVTGHYARIEKHPTADRYRLLRGHDFAKDQSYVLASLTQSQLSRIWMPLGQFSKPDIRRMAEELELGVAKKKESMDLCFIPDGDTAGFLNERMQTLKPGPILDANGEKLGEHQGLGAFTIGQRKGLGIATGKPRYVLELKVAQNTLVVGSMEDLERDGIKVDELNWIDPEFAEGISDPGGRKASIQYRSTHRGAPGRVEGKATDEMVTVRFDQKEAALSPGQAAVFYIEDEVVGGGTISSSF
ncbi:MAG TPA: tRNA 2-thiouridine(34) synthase MnmA [Phycisphaerales bacterium]|nr:tRNA 2-thiouridine(34) synthase MnmA [Phycisphaerales bacterium]